MKSVHVGKSLVLIFKVSYLFLNSQNPKIISINNISISRYKYGTQGYVVNNYCKFVEKDSKFSKHQTDNQVMKNVYSC